MKMGNKTKKEILILVGYIYPLFYLNPFLKFYD